MEFTDANRKILCDAFEFWRSDSARLRKAFRAAHSDALALIDELEVAHALVEQVNRYRPSVLGIIESQHPDAERLLRQCGGLWGVLAAAYSENTEKPWTATEIAKRQGLADTAVPGVRLALELMTDVDSWGMGTATSPVDGHFDQFLLQEDVFRFTADNWIASYRAQLDQKAETARKLTAGIQAEFDRASGRRPTLVFISHSHSDEALATALDHALKAAGVPTFKASRDEEGIPAGGGKTGWFAYIVQKLHESTGLICLASPKCLTEHWATFETAMVYGLTEGKAALLLVGGVGYDDTKYPLTGLQNIAVTETLSKVKARIAEIVGTKSAELWDSTEACTKLEAFLALAKVVPPEPVASHERGLAPLPGFLLTIQEQIETCQSEWAIERRLKSNDRNKTVAIFESLIKALGDARVVAKRAKVGADVLNTLTDLQARAREHQSAQPNYALRSDFALMWKEGAEIIDEALGLVAGLDMKALSA
jgi:hypothetical protein